MMKKRKRNRELRKRTKKRNTVDLPEDLLVEILSRVPAGPLARFRSASKGWNALIKKDAKLARKPLTMLIGSRVYSTSFDSHGIQDKAVKVTSQLSLKDPLSSNSLEEVDIDHVFHCDGLLLCATMDYRLVVWNPCSGVTRWIKPRENCKRGDFYALGISSCNEYKILRVVHHGNGFMEPCLVEYEIYDLTSSSWRGIGKTLDWSIPGIWRRGGVSVNGNTYCLGYGYCPPWTKDLLLSFDFSTERFRHASLPGDHRHSHGVSALSVTREDQQLCMFRARVSCIDVWISTKIESTGAVSWRKFLTVERDSYQRPHSYFVNGTNFLADQENKVLMCMISDSFLHIVGEEKYVRVGVDHHAAGPKRSLLVSYVPSLVQIQQAPIS